MMELIEKLMESIKNIIHKLTKKKSTEKIKSNGPAFAKGVNETKPRLPLENTLPKDPENEEPGTVEADTFGNDILEELKNDRALQLEEEYGILKVLEDDVSASDLLTELNETLVTLKNKKIQQHRVIVQYRYSIYLSDSR